MVPIWAFLFVNLIWVTVGFVTGWYVASKLVYARLKYRYEQGEFRSTESFEQAIQEKEGKE